jgi:hypothetical protein
MAWTVTPDARQRKLGSGLRAAVSEARCVSERRRHCGQIQKPETGNLKLGRAVKNAEITGKSALLHIRRHA